MKKIYQKASERQGMPARAGTKKDQCRFPCMDDPVIGQRGQAFGVPRQSIIKVWVAERLEKVA